MRVIRTGLIGDHIGASRFAAAMEMLCTDHGLQLDFRSIDSAGQPRFNVCEVLAALAAEGRTGTAVTHPHKTRTVFCDGIRIAPPAAGIAALNTVLFTPRGPVGHNTDYLGFLGAWRAAMGARTPGRVAMAGAGGVAAAVGHALARLGAEEIAIWDLTEEPALDLAFAIGPAARAMHWTEAEEAVARADGLVNCTPLGMAQYPGSAFEGLPIGGRSWAFDAVYTPVDTRFLRAARASGLACIDGFELFRHMALASFELFAGCRPDPGVALPALARLRPEEALP